MAPIAYSGALQPKKKSELQEIALALRISDQGTKDEIQARIKKHLDTNTSSLEDDPTFAGLYGRRRRSAQPQLAPPTCVLLVQDSCLDLTCRAGPPARNPGRATASPRSNPSVKPHR